MPSLSRTGVRMKGCTACVGAHTQVTDRPQGLLTVELEKGGLTLPIL